MAGFCGWLGGRARAVEAKDEIARMANALPPPGSPVRYSSARPDAALALSTPNEGGDWLESSEVLCVIEGYPRWAEPTLASIAGGAGGNARALAEAYSTYGRGLTKYVRGEFSFAILDTMRSRAFLSIDRFGIRTLNYAIVDGSLYFGSTSDSVASHVLVDKSLRLQSFFDFLFFVDRIPAPNTIYKAQKKLPPAHCLWFERGVCEVRSYWHVPYAIDQAKDTRSLAEELRAHVRESVSRVIPGDGFSKVGAFLSGGLDSTTIVGFMAQMSNQPVRTFTIGFRDGRYDESPYAEIASTFFGTSHHCHILDPPEVVDVVTKISQTYDEPFANASAIPAYVCATRASDLGVETLVAGDGGDEIFAGNTRYLRDGIFDYYERIPRVVRQYALDPLADNIPRNSKWSLLRRAGKYARISRLPVSARLAGGGIFEAKEPREVFSDSAYEELDVQAPLRLADEIYESAVTDNKLQKSLNFDLRVTLADSDLRKVTRTCQLAGVRPRFPFLDEELVEFSARLPPDLLMANGELRFFYKYAFGDFLPREILDKVKHGFGLPYSEYVRSHGPLRELVCDHLSSLKRRDIFRVAFLDELQRYVSGGEAPPFPDIAWDLMVLESWLQAHCGSGAGAHADGLHRDRDDAVDRSGLPTVGQG